MQRIMILALAGTFFYSFATARGQGSYAAPAAAQSENQTSQKAAPDCATVLDALHQATQPSASASADAELHSRTLARLEQEFNRCTAENNGLSPDASKACSSEQLLNFQMNHEGEAVREVPIWRMPDSNAFFYESGMTIDADGAPNAYHPDNTGLDDLANAGAPGSWQGLAKNQDGEPFVQGPDDPYPGYYVSATALADRTMPVNDPARYIDATKIPYIVLPGQMAREIGARPGDFAFVFNPRGGKSSPAIFGDIGPFDRIGEGSVALAENLGIRSNARNGGAGRGILYLVFPGSGDGRPRPIEEINAEAGKLLQEWGGIARLTACSVQDSPRQLSRNDSAN